MKQIVQHLGSGETLLVDAPAPIAPAGQMVVCTRRSLVSTGTERMLVEFGRAGMIEKARQQPEKVRAVLQKVGTDGLSATIDAVRSKLATPIPLGYSNVGIVQEVGAGCHGFAVGDRIVSNGPHADVVCVPANLCAKVPEQVSDDAAAFTVVASIGLQGIRLAEPTLGEAFVVSGAGLIGLLTVQLLRAHGCRVLAIDFDREKLAIAERLGAETCDLSSGADPVAAGVSFSRGRGVDGVIVTASTASSDPISQGARMCRKRGRIVLVGVTGLELNRSEFYEKELTFQVSCSYGPGRYDPSYETQGNDYPVGFVRWTEQRNFEAVLDMLADRRLDVSPLISYRFRFEEAQRAYATLAEARGALGILLDYDSDASGRLVRMMPLRGESRSFDPTQPVLGVIGAGNYASRVLLPALKSAGAQFHTLVTSGGTSAAVQGERAGFAVAATDTEAMLAMPEINTVAIVTRHDSHAQLAARALEAGKNVFVEKPLAIDFGGLQQVQDAFRAAHVRGSRAQLMVGFNRRFAPQVLRMKELLATVSEPKSFLMTMNAGAIPAGHWTQDEAIGGGRIIGEACHFVDLMRFLAGAPISSVQARRMGRSPAIAVVEDKAAITLGFADGSFGTIMYLANGSASFPKERVEVFTAGGVLQLDNFRSLTAYGWPGFRGMKLWKQDKGQAACAAAFLNAVKTGRPAIAPDEIFEVARVTIEAAQLLREQ